MSAPATPRAGSPQVQAASESTRTEQEARQERQSGDWAAKSAANVVYFMRQLDLSDADAIQYLASHLRLIKAQGASEGIDSALAAIKRADKVVSRYSENGAGE